jgi:exocyst complex component 2
MHQTLLQYVNESANRTLTDIYTTISKAYTRKQGGDEDLQRELNGVKKTLNETRRITQIEFKCFRRQKEKEKAPSSRSQPQSGANTDRE